jgi:hypothetical protein
MKKLLISLFACLALSTAAWADSSTTKLKFSPNFTLV